MQAILRKFWVISQKPDKMVWGRKTSFNFTMSDDSCIQCNSIVRMIRIFSGTDMIKKVPICLFERPICLIEVPNCPGADLSWFRNVSHRCWSVLVLICPGAEVSRIHYSTPKTLIFLIIIIMIHICQSVLKPASTLTRKWK